MKRANPKTCNPGEIWDTCKKAREWLDGLYIILLEYESAKHDVMLADYDDEEDKAVQLRFIASSEAGHVYDEWAFHSQNIHTIDFIDDHDPRLVIKTFKPANHLVDPRYSPSLTVTIRSYDQRRTPA